MNSKGSAQASRTLMTVLRVLRDHPRKVWNVKELASWIDNSVHRHTYDFGFSLNMLRMMKSAVKKLSPGVYQFRDEARGRPLINYIPKKR